MTPEEKKAYLLQLKRLSKKRLKVREREKIERLELKSGGFKRKRKLFEGRCLLLNGQRPVQLQEKGLLDIQ